MTGLPNIETMQRMRADDAFSDWLAERTDLRPYPSMPNDDFFWIVDMLREAFYTGLAAGTASAIPMHGEFMQNRDRRVGTRMDELVSYREAADKFHGVPPGGCQ